MITIWGLALGIGAATVCIGLLNAWLHAWPDEPKPDQWRRYKGVMRLREDNNRSEPVINTAAFAQWLREPNQNKRG